VADYYLVENATGPDWDPAKGRREQAGWDEHAAFMDGLVEEGVIVLGGPTGEGETDNTLLVTDVASEEEIRSRLADDPWAGTILTIASVRPWSVWLRAERAPVASAD
jgi:uncharacterized protein YciI